MVLDLRFVGAGVTGEMAAAGVPPQPFLGWLGLLSVLEALGPGPPHADRHV